MVKRRCCRYKTALDGTLVIVPRETEVVIWSFEQYKVGKSLGKIAAGLEKQGILSLTGKLKWNWEAIDKLLSYEKYTGQVLLQKIISTGVVQIKNDGLMDRYLSPTLMGPLFLMDYLRRYSKKSAVAQRISKRRFHDAGVLTEYK